MWCNFCFVFFFLLKIIKNAATATKCRYIFFFFFKKKEDISAEKESLKMYALAQTN